MPEELPDISLSSLAGPLYIILIFIEILAIKWRGRGGQYEAKDAATSMFMGAGSAVVNGTTHFIEVAVLIFFYNLSPYKIPFTWLSFAVCFVLWDFVYYWAHRYYHRSRWGWAAHVIHHSSQHYNLSTALRQTWTGIFTGVLFLFVPLAFLGFHPGLLALCGGLNLIYQFWFHTEFIQKCPKWFEAVMNTPSHHRVHHARNPRYLDANYAGVFIIWDKLFGSFVPETNEDPPQYGLVTNLGTFNPLRVFSHEYVSIFKDIFQPGISLWQRIQYVFAPPGWCHDGSRQTSKQIKQAYLKTHTGAKNAPGLSNDLPQ